MHAALSLSRRLATRPLAAADSRLRSTAAASASLAASWDRPFWYVFLSECDAISENEVTAQGSFAEAQANYLKSDMQLDALSHEKGMGIVAHFYMDLSV